MASATPAPMHAAIPNTEIAFADTPRIASACAAAIHTLCSRLRIGRRSGDVCVLALNYFSMRYMPPMSSSMPPMLAGLIGVPYASSAMIAAKMNVDA